MRKRSRVAALLKEKRGKGTSDLKKRGSRKIGRKVGILRSDSERLYEESRSGRQNGTTRIKCKERARNCRRQRANGRGRRKRIVGKGTQKMEKIEHVQGIQNASKKLAKWI